MSTPVDISDLRDLASRLLKEGPKKTLPVTPRRIRTVFNGTYVTDTTSAVYVWEHDYYPTLYIPTKSISKDVDLKDLETVTGEGGRAVIHDLGVGERRTHRVISFQGNALDKLDQLTRIEFKAMDEWYEEDTPIAVHPKDPFKRVDAIASGRSIKVSLHGTVLAESPFAMHLYETMLPVRYYLPFTAINEKYLRRSKTKTLCPYKGEAEYYDIVIKLDGEEKTFKDLVWYYTCPNMECAGIKGMACFYNEKVDLWVNGEKEQRPNTHFG